MTAVTTTHSLQVLAKCPADDSWDVYETTVETARFLAVEEILDAAIEISTKTIYQEDVTAELAQRLGGVVTTVGMHSGVRSVCVAKEEVV